MASEAHVHDMANSKGQKKKPYELIDSQFLSPNNQKLRIITIGAGISGILMAYKIQKKCQNVEHVIYEREAEIGGTWLLNRYPGCACDIPSHSYTYNFALNPERPRFFSTSEEIWDYLNSVCEKWNLRQYMKFQTECIGCFWDADTAQWNVTLQLRDSNGNLVGEPFHDKCDVLLLATGILNNYKWPDVKNLDQFKGRLVHAARWPQKYHVTQR